MVKWKVKNPERFVEQLVQGLHLAGENIFAKSQETGFVPVDEGTLKKSGVLVRLANGFVILYRTSYAAVQEFGIVPGTTQMVKKHDVKQHSRKQGGKRVIVSEHERGPFTRTFEDGMEGKFYLSRAFEVYRPKLAQFIARLVKRG